ncbi:phage portal protein [Clostridium beijerinckii]|uniref:phage portal protein n=1 Tax=Clostridium beijerinckii TaxID=1520 RepID=UPI00156E53A8|nr:phage portal protein [Clostridium beijerinckii]NRT70029.1 HK97 family phage portal protein [Clostridium beijerinckii]
MKIIEFFRDMFGTNNTVYLNEKLFTDATKLAIEKFAVNVAVNLISGCISKCEFKTYFKNREIKQDEYYLWNIEPNKNQNSSEFIQELISKLLKNNECLVVEANGQMIIADSFYQREYALVENIFENVSRKDFTFNRTFKMSEVLYFKLNNEDMSILLANLMSGYNELLTMAIGKYKRSGGRKGIVRLDKIATGDEKQKEAIQELFEKQFKTYFESENAVLNLTKGVEYEEKNGDGNKKSTSEMVDIQNLIKEAFERVAQALKIPPALLKGDIADIEKVTDNFLTFCIDPLVDMICEEINRKRYGKDEYLKGSYIDIDTTCIRHIDIFAIAEKIDKLIASGMYSIDELRRKLRDTLIKKDWSEKHWITKNYQDINSLEGGDNNGEANVVNQTAG